MKTIFRKLATFCTFLALCLASGFAGAHSPTITPDVNLTWRNSVTTAKANVEFHGISQSNRALSWFGFAPTDGYHISKMAVLTNLGIAAFIGGAVATQLGPQFGMCVAGGIFALGTIVPIVAGPPSQGLSGSGMAFAGVEVEVWAKDIEETLFPENDFMWEAKDDNDKLVGTKVHLPQSGAPSRVVKNRSVFPATAVPRVDTLLDYEIDTYTTDPRHITMTEEEVVSYPKRQSIIEQDMETLTTDTAANLLYQWGVKVGNTTNLYRSTGTARAPYLGTQTGNRNTVVFADFLRLHMMLNYMKVPNQGRCVLVDPGLNNDLLQIKEFNNSLYIGQTDTVKSGFIGSAVGFKFYVRSEANTYSNDASPILNAVGATPQATDNLSIMAWHPKYVRRAWGNLANGGLKVFENPEQALYYGNVLSLLVRCGGTQARADGAGVVTLIEGQ